MLRDSIWPAPAERDPTTIIAAPDRTACGSIPCRFLTADRDDLLRVPGIGPVTAQRILDARKSGSVWRIENVGLRGRRLEQVRRHAVME